MAPQTRGLLLTAAAEPVGDLTLIGPIELFGRTADRHQRVTEAHPRAEPDKPGSRRLLDADIRLARRRATAGAIASASKEQRVRSSHAVGSMFLRMRAGRASMR